MKVLFICRGNVGRSQIAESIFNLSTKDKYNAFSAGTKVNENEGQKLKEIKGVDHVLEVLNELGIDAKNNIRNQLTPEILESAEIIISMAEPETIPEYLKNNEKVIFWDVIDPYNQSLEFTRQTRDKINSLVQDLIIKISTSVL